MFMDFITVTSKTLRNLRRRRDLLMGKFGMGMQFPIEVLFPTTYSW